MKNCTDDPMGILALAVRELRACGTEIQLLVTIDLDELCTSVTHTTIVVAPLLTRIMMMIMRGRA